VYDCREGAYERYATFEGADQNSALVPMTAFAKSRVDDICKDVASRVAAGSFGRLAVGRMTLFIKQVLTVVCSNPVPPLPPLCCLP
jgi:hypothetical protein